jgi:[acyl-carrier-protein] S-malonyltransferase
MESNSHQKIAFLFPGQGAQYPGMGKDFFEQFPVARAIFEEADEILSRPFSKLIFEGPSEELTLTKNSQLAIYIVSMAVLRTVQQQLPHLVPYVCAGLSLGEYTALTAASMISFNECLQLVKARAEYMNEACEKNKGTMQVVLGLEPEAVEKIVSQLNPPHQVWVANLNCPGQVVIAGSHSGLEAAALALKENGAKRVLPLDVSGAFHSGLMEEARVRLKPQILQTKLFESPIQIVMNTPGKFVSSLDQVREFMIEQVTQPVRWEKGVRAMMESGVEYYIEMGCGKTLSGMNKRIGVTAPTLSIEKVADMEELIKLGDSLYASAEK